MASFWQKSASLLRAPANELAFAVRSRVRWSRGRPRLPSEAKGDLLSWLSGEPLRLARSRVEQLEARHDLGGLAACSTRRTYAENLALLDRLEALFGGCPLPQRGGALQALDVGCGPFQYATALHRWFAKDGARVRLLGVEIDGHGIYRDGHSRADHARAHAALAGPEVSFEVADFTRLQVPPQDVVSMFYPFLNAYSLLRWGSPLSHLKPRQIVRRAVASVRPGGLLLVANQTEAELARLRRMLAGLPVSLLAMAPFATPLLPYASSAAGRIGSLWRRNGLLEAGPKR